MIHSLWALSAAAAWPLLLACAGYALASFLRRGKTRRLPRLSEAFLLGCVLVTLVAYVWLACFGRITLAAWTAGTLLLLIAAGWGVCLAWCDRGDHRRVWRRRWRAAPAAVCLMLATFAVMAVYAGNAGLSRYDARAIYGLKAKVLADGGSVWGEDFMDVHRAHFHPDYPLLVPLLEAEVFALRGDGDDLGVLFLSLGFVAALVGIIVAAAERWGRRRAIWWGVAVLAIPLVHGVGEGAGLSGSADLPLAALLAAGLLSLVEAVDKRSHWAAIRAGIFLAGAVLTKQEAFLWLLGVAAAGGASLLFRRGSESQAIARPVLRAAAGSLVVLLPVVGLLALVHGPMPDSPYYRSYTAALDPAWLVQLEGRPAHVAGFALGELVNQAWGYVWILVVGVLCLRRRQPMNRHTLFLRALLVVMALGYTTIFIVTPYQIDYHLHTAFRRLWVQMLPVAVLVAAEQLWATGWTSELAAAVRRFQEARIDPHATDKQRVTGPATKPSLKRAG